MASWLDLLQWVHVDLLDFVRLECPRRPVRKLCNLPGAELPKSSIPITERDMVAVIFGTAYGRVAVL